MKRVATLIATTGALTLLGSSFVGVASASAAAPSPRSVLGLLSMDKGNHDICVGLMDSNGVQHPWFCINLPQTKKGSARTR